MSPNLAIILGSVVSLVLTILAIIFIMPQKKVNTLNKFWYEIHKIINFKSLLIEKILKVLYILSTCSCVCTGFFLLFSVVKHYSYYSYESSYSWMGLYGLLLIILGPIIVRLVYEGFMLIIILTNNTNDIKKALIDNKCREESQEEVKIEHNFVFCTKCGTRYDSAIGGCPNGCDQNTPSQTQDDTIE